MTVKGVDISVIQGNVDFVALKNSGIDFVICRCGVGNQSVDKNYTKNIADAKAAGLKVMAYHFIFPLPSDGTHPGRDPKEQAKMHFDAAQGELAAIDCEWPVPQDWKKWGCSASQVAQWTMDYLQEYERLSGRKPVVYTYPNFAQMVNFPTDIAQYPLWIASYQPKPVVPKPWTDWAIWQTGGGNLMKLSNGSPVDTDVAKDLSLWDDPAPSTTDTQGSDTSSGNVFTKIAGLFGNLWK